MDYSVFKRLDSSEILQEFNLFNSNSNSKCKLMSLNWRLSFNLLSTNSSINQSRNEFNQLKLKYLTSSSSSSSTLMNNSRLQVDNPLSNEFGNIWTTWFKDLELKKIIKLDVSRSFPEIDYFKSNSIQDKLLNLLFIYTKLNQTNDETTGCGYSQGLHEILAPILFLCDLDSLPSSKSISITSNSYSTTPLSNEALAHLILSRDYIEHDTFTLFQAIMKPVSLFYDSNRSVALPIERLSPNSQSIINSRSTIISSSSAPKLLVQPIIGIANRIQDKLLKTFDFELYSTLVALEIEPQLYVIRWLRLLFSREFSFNEIIPLWTGLFAEECELKLVEYIVVAMLLRIREAIITHQEDYTNALQLLLRYPLPNFQTSFKIEILLRQAIYLRDNTTAEAGERCRQENIELGLESGEIDEEKRSRTLPPNPPIVATPVVYSTSQIAAALLAEGVGGIARRAELMGVNKALIGTFNDIRRGVNSIDSEFPARAFTRDRDSAVELNRLRNENLAMSKALETCVDILQNRFDIAPKKDEEGEDGKGIMTLTVINHIKQVLAGSTHFDRHVLSPLTAVTVPPLSPSASITATTSSPVNPSPPTVQRPVSTPPLLLGQRSTPPPLTSLTRTLDPKLSSTASTTSALPAKPIAPLLSPTTFPPPPVLAPVENRFAAASQRMDLSKRQDRKYEDRIEDPLGVGVDI